MAREVATKAGLAAAESVLQAMMPQLLQKLDGIEARLDQRLQQIDRRLNVVEQRIDQLRSEMYDKFEQSKDVVNELGQRIARVEGMFEIPDKSVNRQTDKMEVWIERLVKLEMSQGTRRRKAS